MADSAQKPLRMTAREFVTAMAVMAGAAQLKPRTPKPRFVLVERPLASRLTSGPGR
jgi:hypothetical protein